MPINAYQYACIAHQQLHNIAETTYYPPFFTASGRTSAYTLLEHSTIVTEENIKRKAVCELIPTLYDYRYRGTPARTFQINLSSENALEYPFEKNNTLNCLTNCYTRTSTTWNTINFIKINKGINNIRGLLLESTPANAQCSEVINLLKSNHPAIIGLSIGIHATTDTLTINVFVKEQHADTIVDTMHAYPLILALTHPETEVYQTIAQEIATLSTLAPKEYCEYITQSFNNIKTQLQAAQTAGLSERLASRITEQKTKKIRNEKQTYKNDIDCYESKLRDFYKRLDELQLLELGIQESTKNLKTDLETTTKRYSKYVTLIKLSPNNDKLKVRINTTLRIYNEEQAKLTTKYLSNSNRKTILEKLFVSGKYTLLIQQDFVIDFLHEAVEAVCTYDTTTRTLLNNDNLPGNPHLTFHNCLGQNRIPITKAITNLDIEGLYTALIACASSMNLYDSTVVNSLSNFLLNCLNNESTANLPIIYDEENQTNISLKQLMEIANDETNNTEQG